MTTFDAKIVSTMLLNIIYHTNENIAIRKLFHRVLFWVSRAVHILHHYTFTSFTSEVVKFVIRWTYVKSFSLNYFAKLYWIGVSFKFLARTEICSKNRCVSLFRSEENLWKLKSCIILISCLGAFVWLFSKNSMILLNQTLKTIVFAKN